MNFLELAQRLRQECGVAGTGPLSTQNQIGEAKRLVDYINTAWLEIQGLHDNWNFMRWPFEFDTVAGGTGDYTPSGGPGVGAGLSDFRYWHCETLRAQRKSIGLPDQQWLVQWEYQVLRDTYRFNVNVEITGRPVVFAVKPNGKALMFGQIPDDVYTITGEYQSIPKPLVGDSDEPTIPTHLHMVIVYKAMEYYGMYEAASEVIARAKVGYSQLMNILEREQLQEVYLANPLA